MQLYADVIKKDYPDIIKTGYEIDDNSNGSRRIYSVPQKMILTNSTDIFRLQKNTVMQASFGTPPTRELINDLRFYEKLKWLDNDAELEKIEY